MIKAINVVQSCFKLKRYCNNVNQSSLNVLLPLGIPTFKTEAFHVPSC